MNYRKIVLGGLAGGVAFSIVSIAINLGFLMKRYLLLMDTGVLRKEPRIVFPLVWFPVLFLVSIGCVWFYAAVRPRLGAGPRTALTVGCLIGLMAGVPLNVSNYAWTYTGGFVSLFWTLEILLGCIAATLVGAWIYRE